MTQFSLPHGWSEQQQFWTTNTTDGPAFLVRGQGGLTTTFDPAGDNLPMNTGGGFFHSDLVINALQHESLGLTYDLFDNMAMAPHASGPGTFPAAVLKGTTKSASRKGRQVRQAAAPSQAAPVPVRPQGREEPPPAARQASTPSQAAAPAALKPQGHEEKSSSDEKDKPSTCACFVPPIVRMAEKGKLKEVLKLLDNGADPKESDDFGLTALHGAAKKGHASVVLALAERGANVNAPSRLKGETPMHYACKYGQLEAARLLLRFGADPSVQTTEGKCPKDYAEDKRQLAVLALLEETAAPNASPA